MLEIKVKRWDKLNNEVVGESTIPVADIASVRGKHFMLSKKKVKGRVPSHEGCIISINGQGQSFCAETLPEVLQKIADAKRQQASEQPSSEDQQEQPSLP